MAIMDEDTDAGPDTPRLPMLLEAVLSVGTDLELRTTLQHIVDSATELTGARYGAGGGGGTPRAPPNTTGSTPRADAQAPPEERAPPRAH
ncbi:hypothetical protein ACFWVK_33215, partial [Streptomyces sp. NPDC058667]